MEPSDTIVAAVVRVGSIRREVRVVKNLGTQQTNLLFVLSEFVGQVISFDDICHRMKIGLHRLQFVAHLLRKSLTDDWTVDVVSSYGYRLVYLGGTKASNTLLELRETRFKRKRRPPHSAHTRELMRQAAIRRFNRPSSSRVRF